MSKAANVNYLEALHKIVAEALTTAITEATKEDAEPVSPQLLAQALKFLKDNGIEPARDADNSALDKLALEVGKVTSGETDLKDYLN
jgi:hypothetical protein